MQPQGHTLTDSRAKLPLWAWAATSDLLASVPKLPSCARGREIDASGLLNSTHQIISMTPCIPLQGILGIFSWGLEIMFHQE